MNAASPRSMASTRSRSSCLTACSAFPAAVCAEAGAEAAARRNTKVMIRFMGTAPFRKAAAAGRPLLDRPSRRSGGSGGADRQGHGVTRDAVRRCGDGCRPGADCRRVVDGGGMTGHEDCAFLNLHDRRVAGGPRVGGAAPAGFAVLVESPGV